MNTVSDQPNEEQSYLAGVIERRRHRRNRRIIATGIMAVLGLIFAGVWAVNIVSTSPGDGSEETATLFLGDAPTGDTSALGDYITAGPDDRLRIDFTGRWGDIPTDPDVSGAGDPDAGFNYELFDITTATAGATRRFYVEVGVHNTPTNFSALQLEWVLDDQACATADLDNPGVVGAGLVARTLYVESSDSTVVFSALQGDTAYCIGIADTGGVKANDPTGTFIRRVPGSTPTRPAFFAVFGEHNP